VAIQHEIIELQAPIGGLRRSLGYQQKPPFYTEDCDNVRAFDVIEDRGRIGSRPGTVKVYAQRLGLVPVESFTMDFFASKDTYLDSLSPSAMYGTAGGMSVGPYFTIKYRIVIHFDLGVIPDGATIVTASLAMWCLTSAASGNGVVPHKLKRLTQPGWIENQCSWNDYKAATAWSLAGGDFTETDALDWTPPSAVGAFTISGLVTLASDAYVARSKQLHLLFMANDETVSTGHRTDIDTKESGTPSQRPKLTVTYEVPV